MGAVRMPSRSSSLAKSQRHPSLSDGESRPRGLEPLAVRDGSSRNIAHPPAAVSSPGGPLIPARLRHDMIRDAAYFRAQARGFVSGKEIEDWLAAEQDIGELIMRRYGR
jgi:hypothetical protein